MKTFNEFSLETTERRYRESLQSCSRVERDLRAFEYIAALESALHGKRVAA